MADDRVNKQDIMSGIRDSIRRKKEAGVYTDADVLDVAERGRSADVFASHIELLKRNSSVMRAHEFTSHRPVIGPLVVFTKRTLFKLFLKIGGPFLERQDALNQQSIMLMEAMSSELTELRRRAERADEARTADGNAVNARIDAIDEKVATGAVATGATEKVKNAG